MQVLPPRAVKLAQTCLIVDFDSRLSACRVEPKCDVCSSRLDKRSSKGVSYVLLDNFGQVVHFSKQNYPAIVCGIMVTDFFRSVESLFGQLNWQILV